MNLKNLREMMQVKIQLLVELANYLRKRNKLIIGTKFYLSKFD